LILPFVEQERAVHPEADAVGGGEVEVVVPAGKVHAALEAGAKVVGGEIVAGAAGGPVVAEGASAYPESLLS